MACGATVSPTIAFVLLQHLQMDISYLVREAKKGSAAAQKCIFDEWAGKMLLVCRRYVKAPEDAEELMLDGFHKFFRSLGGFEYQGDAALFAWLKKIMVNECLMFMRKKNLFVLVSESNAENSGVEEEALNRMSAAEIFNLIVQLPAGYRTVFNLYEIEGMSHREIATLLGISEGTSKSQLSKAKTSLQKMLAQNESDYAKRNSK
jgi:RNA polymerase sigma-70 factor (ECF subfamily)